MVAKIVSGKSIRGILNYNENKVASAEAQLLMACGFPRDPDELTFKNKLQRFELLTSQNEKTKTNALHITLNFSNQDTVDDELLQRIALDYMNQIGFGHQPFLVYRHYDAAHPHIHIATVNIEEGGNRIETHNIGKNQSEKARREIEISYGLIKAEDQQKEMAYLLQPVKLERAIYGKSETKAAISAIVREVTGSYKFTSLPELNAALRQFGVLAYPGAEGTLMRQKGGLVYCLLNEEGDTVGIPIKASSIFGSPTLKNLEKKYPLNDSARKPFGLRLKHQLDKAISSSADMAEFQDRLQLQGIRVLLRINADGRPYGITFIDNATRTVFNGSDLGKSYSIKSFMDRLAERSIPLITAPSLGGTKIDVSEKENELKPARDFPAHDQPVIESLWDIAFSDSHEENLPDPFRRKKKKRLQAE